MKRKCRYNSANYPQQCELCDKEFKNAKEMKTHMKTHSYKATEYQCEDCEYVGQNKETMDVHNGRAHCENFECGLCEFEAGSLDNLDMHLRTCEIYQCWNCAMKEKNVDNMRTHIEKEHGKFTVIHLKMDRNNFSRVSCRQYSSKNI